MFTEGLKSGIRRTFIYDLLWPIKHRRQYEVWVNEGRPVPPPAPVKHQVIEEYARKYGHQVFIETGTYRGDTIHAVRSVFNQIYSIELGLDLAEKARVRFRNQPHISINQGDSGIVLPKILSGIVDSCLFWLDAHYSAGVTALASLETPIHQELKAILSHPNEDHTILIDDARDFNGRKGYPELDQLREFVTRRFPSKSFEVKDDIIRIRRHAEPLATGSLS